MTMRAPLPNSPWIFRILTPTADRQEKIGTLSGQSPRFLSIS
jgi:hypothetical protein